MGRSYYEKLNLKYPKNQELENDIEEALMKFYENSSDESKESALGFGDVEPPYFDFLNDDIKNAILNIVQNFNKDVLIEYQQHDDEEGEFLVYCIYKG